MTQIDKNILSDWLNLLDGNYDDKEVIELPVITGSMMPLIIPGKMIRIKCIKEPDISVGDIIVFKKGKEITSHRLIVKIRLCKKTYLYQKGDSMRFGEWINVQQVVGIVDSVQDGKGNFISLITSGKKKEGRDLAVRQLFRTFLNLFLILPRRIKRCIMG